jgi:plasmid stability protein
VATLSVRVPDDLKRVLEARAKGQHRQLSDQARRYLEIALIAEDNPDLSFSMIEAILESRAELEAGLAEPYPFDDEPAGGTLPS